MSRLNLLFLFLAVIALVHAVDWPTEDVTLIAIENFYGSSRSISWYSLTNSTSGYTCGDKVATTYRVCSDYNVGSEIVDDDGTVLPCSSNVNSATSVGLTFLPDVMTLYTARSTARADSNAYLAFQGHKAGSPYQGTYAITDYEAASRGTGVAYVKTRQQTVITSKSPYISIITLPDRYPRYFYTTSSEITSGDATVFRVYDSTDVNPCYDHAQYDWWYVKIGKASLDAFFSKTSHSGDDVNGKCILVPASSAIFDMSYSTAQDGCQKKKSIGLALGLGLGLGLGVPLIAGAGVVIFMYFLK